MCLRGCCVLKIARSSATERFPVAYRIPLVAPAREGNQVECHPSYQERHENAEDNDRCRGPCFPRSRAPSSLSVLQKRRYGDGAERKTRRGGEGREIDREQSTHIRQSIIFTEYVSLVEWSPKLHSEEKHVPGRRERTWKRWEVRSLYINININIIATKQAGWKPLH